MCTLDVQLGALYKRNRLARLGMHHSYEFFRVKSVSPTGRIMGWIVPADVELLESGQMFSRKRWRVQKGPATTRARQMPRPRSWKLVTDDEREHGIVASSVLP